MAQQKTLVLDIETAPILAYVWGLKDQNISPGAIYRDWYVLAWSAKWLYAPASTIMYHDLRTNPLGSDKAILSPLRDLLDEADILVTQNGMQFDCRRLNTRFMLHGMRKPKPYRHFDTWVLASRAAAFTSTKLAYLTDVLRLKHKKLEHGKYPGLKLWIECLKGNKTAWDEMKKYNIHDTLSTEELAIRLKEWAPKAFPDWTAEKCGSCDKVKTIRVKCQECGKWGK